jgi:glycosyltransferase involved in cell wall biosynthesis
MSAGLPVIASSFPLWREIIEGNACGICVDPLDEVAIAKAIEYIVENPYKAQHMGENGLKAVQEKYNWDNQELKLLQMYKALT